jgi:FHS family L-fucose permease-like MFS transporter
MSNHAARPAHPAALALITALFFAWGFLSSLNNVLVPHFKEIFALGYAGGALVNFAFFSAYFLTSLPSGKIVAAAGYRRGIVIGLLVSAAGALLFYPAATLLSYPLFLGGLFVLAAGITLLQVAANPYVAALGKPETASSRLNLTQAFNSLGTTVAPLVGGLWILSHPGESSPRAAARAVQLPYLLAAATLVSLAVVVALAHLPPIAEHEGPAGGSLLDALRVRRLRLAMVGIFVYVGAETAIGSFLVDFLADPAIAALPATAAARYVSYYWGGAMIGRFAGAAVLRRRDPGRVLAACAVTATALIGVGALARGDAAMWAVIAVGLCNSIMFPTIFTLGIDGLGPLTSRGSSLLVMSIVGGAIIPVLVGWLADRAGVQRAYGLTALSYVYIAYYGLRGSRHA